MLTIPHTSTIVLLLALAIAVLVYAASWSRSSLEPRALGATIAVLAFVMTARTLRRGRSRGHRQAAAPA